MNLSRYFMDEDWCIPAQVVWEALDEKNRRRAFEMLRAGKLQAEGRPVFSSEYHPQSPGKGNICEIGREAWADAIENGWILNVDLSRRMQLTNGDHGHQYVDIQILNSVELRDLVGFERKPGSVEEFDEIWLRASGSKMGAKVWAAAAAALASQEVNCTAKALVNHLFSKPDLWPKGMLHQRKLEEHLAPFVREFVKLTNPTE